MANVYALLVGIDMYPPSIPALKGCVQDISEVAGYLDEVVGSRARLLTLANAEATRDAVIDGFRYHLRQAGPGDTALFWFCGHGSTVPAPPALRSSASVLETLVCADSRAQDHASRDLLDLELAQLIGEVAAAGAHVAVVLDCCHAGGATRQIPDIPAATPRETGTGTMPDPAHILPALLASAAGGALPSLTADADHVLLAACRRDQKAYETPYLIPDTGEARHGGVFTRSLLLELRRRGLARTYRELAMAARMHVENAVANQTPVLYPATSPLVDQPFLGGLIHEPAATVTMRWQRDHWVVNAGRCHGVPAATVDDAVRFAVHDSMPVREARLVRTDPGQSVVEPVGWQPDRQEVYPMVLSSVALPQVSVAIGDLPEDDPALAAQVRRAVASAGPGGVASPHVRVVTWADTRDLPELVVATPVSGDIAIQTPDGTRLDGGAVAGRDRVRVAVSQLEHIAVWRRIRTLANPVSRLSDAVRLEIIEPLPGEHRAPRDRPGLRPHTDGTIKLHYRPTGEGYRAPTVFMRLDNVSDQRLFCVLLDLTDQFRIHAGLYPGDFIEPGGRALAGGGHLIEFSLPPDRPVRRDELVRDWLMLIVSEDPIDPQHFALPRLGEPPRLREPSPGTRHGVGLPGLVERLALSVRLRDADVKPSVARDWWTSVTSVTTHVGSAA